MTERFFDLNIARLMKARVFSVNNEIEIEIDNQAYLLNNRLVLSLFIDSSNVYHRIIYHLYEKKIKSRQSSINALDYTGFGMKLACVENVV